MTARTHYLAALARLHQGHVPPARCWPLGCVLAHELDAAQAHARDALAHEEGEPLPDCPAHQPST
jgi:hypothetical protein